MKILSNFRTMVMQKAWELVHQTGVKLADALKDAWALIKLQALKALMRAGAVLVTFRKVSGDVTTRIATRNMAQIPSEKHPKTSKETEYVWSLPFFDLGCNGWKCLKAENILSFSIL